MTTEAAVLPDFLPAELAQALAGAQRAVTALDGVRTVWHVWGAPERPTVVLLHGGSGSWTHWVRNIAPLRDAGWRVLVPDLPGFGDSDLPPGCTDVPQLPAHLHAGLQQIVPQGPVQIVGFSFGGMTGALWLAEHPDDAQALVLVGAPGLGLSAAQRTPLKGWRHMETPEQQYEVHRHNLMALMFEQPSSLDDLALALHAANVARDRMPRRRLSSTPIVAEALPRVRARVSAIYGEHDACYRQRLIEVREALPRWAPHWGQWHTVPGAGHWVIYEAADAFNAALLAQLRGL
ncbi:MAG: alpha/beta fold hydrolase [Limnohabitans sp.]